MSEPCAEEEEKRNAAGVYRHITAHRYAKNGIGVITVQRASRRKVRYTNTWRYQCLIFAASFNIEMLLQEGETTKMTSVSAY